MTYSLVIFSYLLVIIGLTTITLDTYKQKDNIKIISIKEDDT